MRRVTAVDLRGTRKALGLNQRQMAELLHYGGENGDRTIRNLEAQEAPLSGPIAMALTYLRQGLLDEVMELVIPEYIIGEDLALEIEGNFIYRALWPRFLALVTVGELVDVLGADDAAMDCIELEGGEVMVILMWIDEPYRQDVQGLLTRAAEALRAHSVKSNIV